MKRLLYFFTIVLLVSCEHDIVEPDNSMEQSQGVNQVMNPCDPNKVYFQNDILPIFTSTCAYSGCHDAGTATKGVILTTYENVINSNVIDPFDPDDSELFERITDTDVGDRMPLGKPPLNSTQIQKIRQWILDGAQNSECNPSGMCDTTNLSYSMDIEPLLKNKCQGCHNPSSLGGGIDLTTYSGVKSISDDRRIINAIIHAPGFKAMPLGGQMLPPCEIKKIRTWVESGAPNN